MKIIDVLQGSEEWKALRRTMVTATDCAVIIGMNPWKNKVQLWEEKLCLREIEINQKMLDGSKMEEEARQAFIKLLGKEMNPLVAIDDDNPWLMSSLDGFNGKHALEIKCGKKSFEQAKKKIIPDLYKCQMNAIIQVCKIDSVYYWCYYEGQGELIEYERDRNLIDRIIIEGKQFYDDLMNLRRPKLECDLDLDEESWNAKLEKTWKEALE